LPETTAPDPTEGQPGERNLLNPVVMGQLRQAVLDADADPRKVARALVGVLEVFPRAL
jgi:hypothetical protein